MTIYDDNRIKFIVNAHKNSLTEEEKWREKNSESLDLYAKISMTLILFLLARLKVLIEFHLI